MPSSIMKDVQEEFQKIAVEKWLPETGKPILREPLDWAIQTLANEQFLSDLLSALNREDKTVNEYKLESIIESHVLWFPAILKGRYAALRGIFESAGLNPNMQNIEVSQLTKKSFDTLISQLHETLGEDAEMFAERNTDIPIAFIIVLASVEIKKLEQQRLTGSYNPQKADAIRTEVEIHIANIAEIYRNVQVARLASQLIALRLEEVHRKSNGGKNNKSNKDAIFADFIAWVKEGIFTEKFQFPIQAARHYLQNELPLRKPDLVKYVSATTPRTATEKLDQELKDSNTPSPFPN